MANFDHVSVEMPGGGHNLITAQEFWKMELMERFRLIRDGKVKFLKDGAIVPPREALKDGPK